MSIEELRDALRKNETSKIIAIETKCREKIRSEVAEKGGRFKVPPDYFSFIHVNDSIKNIVLEGKERENKMIVVTRYV